MRLEESLVLTAEVFEPKTFSAFRELVDPEWIRQALRARGDITMRRTRRRRLPAEEIIWLVALCARKLAMMVPAIGMALFRD
jgi:hypothetical protein